MTLQINKRMRKNSVRDHYARWDKPATEKLIRLILTDEKLKLKMQSLIEKHHTREHNTSQKMVYGSMKDYTVQIGLGRGDSRSASIKMINIAKSFIRKEKLPKLFVQGWRLSSEVANTPTQGPNANIHLEGSKKNALEDIILKITNLVTTFTRMPVSRKRVIRKESSVASHVSPSTPAFRQTNIGTPYATPSGRTKRNLEDRSHHLSAKKTPIADSSDQLSRVDDSLPQQQPTPSKSELSIVHSEDPRHTLNSLLRSKKTGKKDLNLEVIEKLHELVDLNHNVLNENGQMYDPVNVKKTNETLNNCLKNVMKSKKKQEEVTGYKLRGRHQ